MCGSFQLVNIEFNAYRRECAPSEDRHLLRMRGRPASEDEEIVHPKLKFPMDNRLEVPRHKNIGCLLYIEAVMLLCRHSMDYSQGFQHHQNVVNIRRRHTDNQMAPGS